MFATFGSFYGHLKVITWSNDRTAVEFLCCNLKEGQFTQSTNLVKLLPRSNVYSLERIFISKARCACMNSFDLNTSAVVEDVWNCVCC